MRLTRRLDLKLALGLTALVVVISGAFVAIIVRLRERELLNYLVRGADQLSRSVTSATWHAMLADHRQDAYQVMDTIAAKQGVDRIRIFNKEGRVMFSTDPADVKTVNKQAEACYVCHAREQPLVRVTVPKRYRIYRGIDGKRKLGMVTPIYNERSCSAAACHAHPASQNVLGVLDVSLDLDPVEHDLAAVKTRVFLLAAAEILLITFVIVFFTHRFVRRPIRRLVEATRQVSQMNLDQPVETTSTDELGELTHAFDEMRKRLRTSVQELNELAESLERRVQERTDQLRTTQQKLIQSDRLASLGQLAASVAHEINNPVAGVLNLSTLMKRLLGEEGIPPQRLTEFRGFLDGVITETARVGRIVSDLLAFSRRSTPHRGPADLNGIVRRTVSLLDHKLQLADVRLELKLSEDLPPVPCDASQVQQVIVNLVSNAAEAVRQGGLVSVRTRLAETRDAVALEVSDTGPGIPPEVLDRIFDPFFTTKEEGRGTGLGLTVSYGIVHAHGGDIEVRSRVGEGTVFCVTLPLATAPAALTVGGGGMAGPGRALWFA
jgi:two-component system NtrC family sensor kinase